MPESTEDKLLKKDIVELLFKKYSLLRSEVNIRITDFKQHSKNVQVVVAALFAAAGYLMEHQSFRPTNENMFAWLAGLAIAISLIYYRVYDILDSIYEMNTLGERMAQLEKQMNEIAEMNLLMWEIKVSPRMHSQFKPLPGVIAPSGMLWIYFGIMLLIVLVIFLIIFYDISSVPLCTYVWLKRTFLIADVFYLLFSTLVVLPFVTARVLFRMRREVQKMLENAAASMSIRR